jgi:uncharacterized protein (DUF433 family)
MWYNDWQDMYICQNMMQEPQWAEYEEIIEEEVQGITEEEAVEHFNNTFDLPADITEALKYIWQKSRDGEMTDEEMATGFFLCGQIKKHDDTEGADRVFWTLENLDCINYELQNTTSK